MLKKTRKKVLQNTADTAAYLETLPEIHIVGLWVRWGVESFRFSGRYTEDGLVPLVWHYVDFNGQFDEWHLVPINKTTCFVLSWHLDRDIAERIAEALNNYERL